MLCKTFIRKQLRLKAHTVTEIEPSDEQMVVQIERLGARKLCCSRCRRPYRRVHSRAVRERSWRDLSLRQAPLVLRYRPHRVRCSRCGVRVEALPWAEPWARVTKALAGAVAALTRHLNWCEAARHFHLDWKSVATIVKRAVAYGLARRRRRPLHWIGVDEVSRRKGHRYLTVVYDLERRTLLWVGEDRTEQTLRESFSELGRRRCRTLQVVCMDMWAAYGKAVREHAAQAQILFDRFHLVQHLHRAVDEVRRAQRRRRSRKQKVCFKGVRYLDALGDALAAGAVQELCAAATRASRRCAGLDQAALVERRPGRDEQQDQTGEPPRLRLPQRGALRGRHLPLLRPAAVAAEIVITLLGDEPYPYHALAD